MSNNLHQLRKTEINLPTCFSGNNSKVNRIMKILYSYDFTAQELWHEIDKDEPNTFKGVSRTYEEWLELKDHEYCTCELCESSSFDTHFTKGCIKDYHIEEWS